jgi:hypothetical protein
MERPFQGGWALNSLLVGRVSYGIHAPVPDLLVVAVLLLDILLPGSSKAQGDYLVFVLVPPTWTVNLEFTDIDKAEALVASMHFAIQIDGAPQRECGLANEHGWIGKSNATGPGETDRAEKRSSICELRTKRAAKGMGFGASAS